jgi:hypothetical protein
VLGQDDGSQVQVPQVGCKTDEAQIPMDEGVSLDTRDHYLKNEVQRQATKDRYLKTGTNRRTTAVRSKTGAVHRKTNDVRGEMSTVMGHVNAIIVQVDAIGVRLDAVIVQVDARVFTRGELLHETQKSTPRAQRAFFQVVALTVTGGRWFSSETERALEGRARNTAVFERVRRRDREGIGRKTPPS